MIFKQTYFKQEFKIVKIKFKVLEQWKTLFLVWEGKYSLEWTAKVINRQTYLKILKNMKIINKIINYNIRINNIYILISNEKKFL